jgi:hypothetical protein
MAPKYTVMDPYGDINPRPAPKPAMEQLGEGLGELFDYAVLFFTKFCEAMSEDLKKK